MRRIVWSVLSVVLVVCLGFIINESPISAQSTESITPTEFTSSNDSQAPAALTREEIEQRRAETRAMFAPEEEDIGPYYYGWQGKRVPIEMCTDTIGVSFREKKRVEEVVQFLNSDARLTAITADKIVSGEQAKARAGELALKADAVQDKSSYVQVGDTLIPMDINFNGAAVMKVSGAKTKDDIRTLVAELSKRDDVDAVMTAWTCGTEMKSLMTEMLTVVIRKDDNEEKVLALFAEDGAEILKRVDYKEIGSVTYRIRIPYHARAVDASGFPLLTNDYANKYQRSGLVKAAAPVFAPLYKTQTDIPAPTDEQFVDTERPAPKPVRWYWDANHMNAVKAWTEVYGSSWPTGNAWWQNYPKTIIASLDDGVPLDYEQANHFYRGQYYNLQPSLSPPYHPYNAAWVPVQNDNMQLTGPEYANAFSLYKAGCPDLTPNQWFNIKAYNAGAKDIFGWDFVGTDPDFPDGDAIPFSDYSRWYVANSLRGHGFAAAVIEAARPFNNPDPADLDNMDGTESVGLCPSAEIMPIRYHYNTWDFSEAVLNESNIHYPALVVDGIRYAIGERDSTVGQYQFANYSAMELGDIAHILSLCTFSQTYDPELYEAILLARARGVTVIWCANYNVDMDAHPYFPQSFNEMIILSAGDAKGRRSRFMTAGMGSSYGSIIDVMAAGDPNRPGSIPNFDEDFIPNGQNDYDYRTATMYLKLYDPGDNADEIFQVKLNASNSNTAPAGVGLAALMLTKNPALSPTEIEWLMKLSALPLKYDYSITDVNNPLYPYRYGVWNPSPYNVYWPDSTEQDWLANDQRRFDHATTHPNKYTGWGMINMYGAVKLAKHIQDGYNSTIPDDCRAPGASGVRNIMSIIGSAVASDDGKGNTLLRPLDHIDSEHTYIGLYIDGKIDENSTCVTSAAGDSPLFTVRASDNTPVAALCPSYSAKAWDPAKPPFPVLYLAGQVVKDFNTQYNFPSPPGSAHVFRDDANTIVGYITTVNGLQYTNPNSPHQTLTAPRGSLFIRGSVYQGCRPQGADQDPGQGHLWTVAPTAGDDIDFNGASGIQSAINAATAGDIIEVRPGTYSAINFGGKNLVIRSAEPYNLYRTDVRNRTFIQNSANNGRAVTFSGTETWDCSLQGFTIQKNSSYAYGGGIAGNGCDASIMYCKFINNSISGSGACINNVDGIIDRNVFGAYDSSASWASSNIASDAGGACYDCDGIIRLNIFWCNQASYGGALAYCGDTGATNDRYNGYITCNWFIKNKIIYPTGGGGGMANCNGYLISGNILWKNKAEGWYSDGGGMSGCTPCYLQQNTFVENTATAEGGGAAYSYGVDYDNQMNCIYWQNDAPDWEDVYLSSSTESLGHCFTEQDLDASGLEIVYWGTTIGPWVDPVAYATPGFVTQTFNGSNFHDFLHLMIGPDSDDDGVPDYASPCVDRGFTPYDAETGYIYTYFDIDHSVAPRDGAEGVPAQAPIQNNLFDRDIGADEAPTPPTGEYNFWYEDL